MLGRGGRGGEAPIDLGAASYKSLGDVRDHALAAGMTWWTIRPFGARRPEVEETRTTWSSDGRRQPGRASRRRGGCDPHRVDTRLAWRVVYEGHGPAQRVVELLSEPTSAHGSTTGSRR